MWQVLLCIVAAIDKALARCMLRASCINYPMLAIHGNYAFAWVWCQIMPCIVAHGIKSACLYWASEIMPTNTIPISSIGQFSVPLPNCLQIKVGEAKLIHTITYLYYHLNFEWVMQFYKMPIHKVWYHFEISHLLTNQISIFPIFHSKVWKNLTLMWKHCIYAVATGMQLGRKRHFSNLGGAEGRALFLEL